MYLNKTENPSKDALDKLKIMQSADYANCDKGHYTNRNDKTNRSDQGVQTNYQTDQGDQKNIPTRRVVRELTNMRNCQYPVSIRE